MLIISEQRWINIAIVEKKKQHKKYIQPEIIKLTIKLHFFILTIVAKEKVESFPDVIKALTEYKGVLEWTMNKKGMP